MKRRQFIKGAGLCVGAVALPLPINQLPSFGLVGPRLPDIVPIGWASISGKAGQWIDIEFSKEYSLSRQMMLKELEYLKL